MRHFDYYAPYWVILQITSPDAPTYYKLFCSNIKESKWRMNSGITKIELEEDYFYIHGYSGSIYKCPANILESYRVVTMEANRVYQKLVNNIETNPLDVSVTTLPGTTNFLELNFEGINH